MNSPNEKEEFIDCLRKGRTDWHFDANVLKDHFKVDDKALIKDFSEKVTAFAHRIIAYNLDEFLKVNEFEIVKIHNLDIEEDNAAQLMRIEYQPEKFTFIYKRVNMFITKGGKPFMLSIEKEYDPTNCFSIKVSSIDDSGKQILSDLLKYSEDRNFYKGQKIDVQYNFIKSDKKYDWSDIVLPETVKETLQKNINNFIESIDIYKANKIQMKRGIILKGPPGTGKTLVGKILCSKTDWSFIWVPPQYVRHGVITEFCDAARKLSPTILFLEDLDLYAEDRESSRDKALLGQLMNELDGIQENNQILVVATTNKSEYLEEAILNRPGRFDIVVELPAPSIEQIIDMLKIFTKDIQLDPDVDFDKIKTAISEKKNVKYSGAHIREIVNLAILNAIDERSVDKDLKIILKQAHFDKSLDIAAKKKVEIQGFSSTDKPGGSRMPFEFEDD